MKGDGQDFEIGLAENEGGSNIAFRDEDYKRIIEAMVFD